MKNNWEYVGCVGVDAGCVIVADPCYVLKDNGEERYTDNYGENWSEFCDKLFASPTYNRGYHDTGNGMGVVVTSGYGDGVYPVYIQHNEDGRISRLMVDFDEDI